MKLFLTTITATTLALSPTATIYNNSQKDDYYEGLVWDKIDWEREWENQGNIDRYNVATSVNRVSPNIEFKDISYDEMDRNGTLSFDMRFNFTLKGKEWLFDAWPNINNFLHEDEFKVHVGLYESADKNPYDLNEKHSSETFIYNKYAMQDVDNDREIDSLDFTYVLPTSENVWAGLGYESNSDGEYRVKFEENPYFDDTWQWKPYNEDGSQMTEWKPMDDSQLMYQDPEFISDFTHNNNLYFEGYGEDASTIMNLGIANNPTTLEFTNLNDLFTIGGLEQKNIYLFANIYLPTSYNADSFNGATNTYFVAGNTDNNYDVPMMVYNGYFVEDMNIEEINSNITYKEYKVDTTINGVNKDSTQDEVDWANEFVVPYNIEVYDNSTNELIMTSETFTTINGDNTFKVPTVSNKDLRFEINQELIDVPGEFYGNAPTHQEVVLNSGTMPEIGHVDYIENFDVSSTGETTANARFNSEIYYEDSIVEVEPYTVSVVDQQGNVLGTSTFDKNGEQTIELTGLTPGKEYTLSLQSDSIAVDSIDNIVFNVPEEKGSSLIWIIIGIVIAIIAIASIVGIIFFVKKK